MTFSRSAGEGRENWIVMIACARIWVASRSASPEISMAGSALPRVALRHGRPHSFRPGAGKPAYPGLRIHLRYRSSGSVKR